MTAALQILICSQQANGYWAILEPHGQSYLPALTGWGIDPQKLLFVRPNSRDQSSWAIEQCLRSQGLSVTLAWVLDRFPAKVHRRWQMAAEAGGGIGLVFRPLSAQREPIWADLRLQLTPSPAGSEAKRRLEIEVLYRRGGLAIQSQAWEIDHAAGHVHLVS